MFKKCVYLLLVFAVFHNAYAACTSNACTGRIAMLYVNTAVVNVKMDQDMSLLDCALGGGAYIALRPDHPNYNQVYSLLLAAHIANKDGVMVRVDHNSSDCEVSYVTSQ